MMTTAQMDRSMPQQTGESRAFRVLSWAGQIVIALILAQTLIFKFTYAPETQYIFGDRGGRPVATIVGLAELLCVVLLLIPRCAAIGAALSLAVIGGAIFTHLSALGIEVKNPQTGAGDGGLLFVLALIVAGASLVVLWIRRRELPLASRFIRN